MGRRLRPSGDRQGGTPPLITHVPAPARLLLIALEATVTVAAWAFLASEGAAVSPLLPQGCLESPL